MSKLQCLVLMPFAESFDSVFSAVNHAVESTDTDPPIECKWLKEVYAAGKITDDIVGGIDKSHLCVADLTGSNPNVMWEAGYAMASRKPTILISQDVKTLPFDLMDHRVHQYKPGELEELAPVMSKAVVETLERYAIQPSVAADLPVRHSAAPIIAVTGTMHVNRPRTTRRIATLLEPYIALEPLWYCGSNGQTDELAIRFLFEREQKVVVVGYSQYDSSSEIRNLIETSQISFLDASVEAIPRGLEGPSERDVFFASKSDLVVLFWDGYSVGTGGMIDFYKSNAKSLLLGFV